MAKTYFGQGLMTKIFLGATEIVKVYFGSNLVYVNTVVPPAPTPALRQQVYSDFDLVLQAGENANNIYTDFNLDLQVIKGI